MMPQRMMKLSRKHRQVLANSLAWCDETFSPAETDTDIFFGHVDRGECLTTPGSVELFLGWTAHYGNPYRWIPEWEKGNRKNPPIIPPAAWIYEAYFAPSAGHIGGTWIGWANLLIDFIRDSYAKKNWLRIRPVFEVAYKMAAYAHGRIDRRGVLTR